MPWYGSWIKETKTGRRKGVTLLDAIDAIEPPARLDEKPLRLPIRKLYKMGFLGTVAVGRVETGIIRRGMTVNLAPTGITAVINSVEMHNDSLDQAGPGDIVGFSLGK